MAGRLAFCMAAECVRRVVFVEDVLTVVCLYDFTVCSNLLVGRENEQVEDRLTYPDQIMGHLANAHRAGETLIHDLERSQHCWSEYVVANKVLANESTNNLTSVDSNFHFHLLARVQLSVEFGNDIEHFNRHEHGIYGFVNQIVGETFVRWEPSVVAHYHVRVSISVDLVELAKFADAIKLAEQRRKLVHELGRLLLVLLRGQIDQRFP